MPAAGLLSAVLLHVLTLNIWGLPDAGFRVLSPLRAERVAGICQALQTAAARPDGWDVVLLQEVWVSEDRDALKRCGYAFAADLEDRARALDSGLLILSRFPLEKIARLTYSANGDSGRVLTDGEALAHKSALIARLVHPALGAVWVANTHLVSIYDPAHDGYADARRAQFTDYVGWARAQAGAEPLVLGGDLNFGAGTPLWNDLPSVLSGFSQAPGADAACTLCPPNFMHSRNEGKVDQLFGLNGLAAADGRVTLTEPLRVDGFSFNLSDHFGWETSFQKGRR